MNADGARVLFISNIDTGAVMLALVVWGALSAIVGHRMGYREGHLAGWQKGDRQSRQREQEPQEMFEE